MKLSRNFKLFIELFSRNKSISNYEQCQGEIEANRPIVKGGQRLKKKGTRPRMGNFEQHPDIFYVNRLICGLFSLDLKSNHVVYRSPSHSSCEYQFISIFFESFSVSIQRYGGKNRHIK